MYTCSLSYLFCRCLIIVSCRRRKNHARVIKRTAPRRDRCTERRKHLGSHLIQELQVHQIVVGAALYDDGFTGIDPLVPAWETTALNEKKRFEWGRGEKRNHFQGLPGGLSALPGEHSPPLSQALIALHLCFDLSLSNEPRRAEVSAEPAGFTELWRTSGDTRGTHCQGGQAVKRQPLHM